MLDIKTLLVLNLLIDVIGLGTMTVLWARYGRKYGGPPFWWAHMAVQTAGVGLVLLRGAVPGFVTAVAANALLMSSTLLLLMGFERFTGVPSRHRWNYAAFGLYVLALCHFHFVRDSYPMRTLAGSAFIVFVDVQTCLLLFGRVSPAMRRITRIPGLVVAGYAAASLVRILILVSFPQDTELFRSGLADSLAVTAYLCLHICLLISLALALTRRLLDEVASQEEKFGKAFHSSPYALVISRQGDGRILEVNDGFRDIFGFSRQEALGGTLAGLGIVPPALASAGARRLEIQAARKSGEPLVGQLTTDELLLDGERCVLSSISDVTEESRLRRMLQDLATRDSLTGLPNRRLFHERFEIARDNADRQRTRMGLLSLDLDKFKDVNDSLGHAAGDAVLVEAARRLEACLRKVDVAARFGGDEFVVLLPDVRDAQDALHVAAKIVDALGAPFQTQGRAAPIASSLGVSLYPDHGRDIGELLKASDDALYRAKQAGGAGFALAAPRPAG